MAVSNTINENPNRVARWIPCEDQKDGFRALRRSMPTDIQHRIPILRARFRDAIGMEVPLSQVVRPFVLGLIPEATKFVPEPMDSPQEPCVAEPRIGRRFGGLEYMCHHALFRVPPDQDSPSFLGIRR